MKIFKAYKIFQVKLVGYATLALAILLGVASFFPALGMASAGEWTFFVVFSACFYLLYTVVSMFADFFQFGGIAIKRQNMMEYVHASDKGHELVLKGLIGDLIVKCGKMFIAGGIPSIVILVMLKECTGMLLMTLVSNFFAGIIIMCLALMVSRRFGTTMQTSMFFAYGISIVGIIFFIPAIAIYLAYPTLPVPIMIGLPLLYIGLAALTVYLLLKLCIDGFDSGTQDTK